MVQKVIHVEGMSCDHCVRAVEGALKQLKGVDSAKVSLTDRHVFVEYDENKVNEATMKEAIEDQGYDVKQ